MYLILISLWLQLGLVPGNHYRDGTVNHLSGEDVFLLKDEQNPKCFTRTSYDFTCFIETEDDRTYDFYYQLSDRKQKCELSVQRTEEGTFLHICSFPSEDVFLLTDIDLNVMDHATNNTIYSRTVFVEDNFLLDAPFNVSLHQTNRPGQLRVTWKSEYSKYYEENMMYRIRYSSKRLGEKTKEETTVGVVLDSLIPGDEVEVQVSARCGAGHWSSWSGPVRAAVPESADAVSLICSTSDLQTITCHWNGSKHGLESRAKLYYQMKPSQALLWSDWTECPSDKALTDECRFHGDESRNVRVKLISTSAAPRRTFFTEEFTLNKRIKTSPPTNLRGKLEKRKLCLKWEAPPPLTHLQYEVLKITTGEAWMMISLKGPETGTCLDVPTGSQYSVKIRARPNGPIYSGDWSDWSEVFTGDIPTDSATLLMLCIPVAMVITTLIFISLFYRYLSKLKKYFWPPVPNLDKVLQGFLTEIDHQRWDPPMTAKQCCEETNSSVVEIMSEEEVSGLERPPKDSTLLLSEDIKLLSRNQVNGSPGADVFPDYVTLNKDSVILCPSADKCTPEVGEKDGLDLGDEVLGSCLCGDGSACVPPCLGIDFLNHSYLSLAESADKLGCKVPVTRGPGNLYTNFPCG